nr:beta-lactamase family protein [Actinomycetota bacterium]
MKPLTCLLLLLLVCPLVAAEPTDADRIARVTAGLRPANVIDGDPGWDLEERMRHYGVPAVGIAVIEDYRVAWFEVWGLADRETGEPVKRTTLFQAGSISKPVAAFGAMKMVQLGRLQLDGAVNDKLSSWKLP